MWESDIEEREARRKKMLVFGGSAVAVLVGFVGLYFGLSAIAGGLTDDPPGAEARGDETRLTVVTNEGVDLPAQPPPETVVVQPIEVASDLDWYAIDSPLGFASRVIGSPTGSFYALSTVPGETNVWPAPAAIYKSSDAENWEIISLDNTISAHDMALRGETIYLIGTSPAIQDFREPAEVLLSVSGDDGASWEQSLLTTTAEPPGGAPIEWANVSMRIAGSDRGVLAVVNSQFYLDYSRMVPAEFVGNNLGYQPVDEGIAVIDWQIMDQMYMACEGEMEATGGDVEQMSPECQALFEGNEAEIGAIAVVTWEELGLPDGGSPFFSEMFLATDGVNFEKIESPLSPSSELGGLYASDGGFIALEWGGAGGQTMWWSEDGREWDATAGLADFDWITTVGSIDGKAVVLGQGRESSLAAWQNDAGGWDLVDFDAVLGAGPMQGGRWMTSGGVGPLGVVVVFQSFDERAGRESTEVVVGTAPDTWSLVEIDAITGISGGYSDWVAVGTEEIIMRYEVFNEFRPRSLQIIASVPEET